MAVLGLQEAAERIETSKVDVWRAIQAGRLSAQRTEDGGIAIDPAELFRVFKPQQPDKRPVGQHATASLETSERPERIAQLSEPAGERAKADKAIAKCAALEESAKPWWRRLAHPRRPDSPEAPAGKTVEEDMAPALQEAPPQPDRLMPTCRSVVMPVLMPRATPIHNSARADENENQAYGTLDARAIAAAPRAALLGPNAVGDALSETRGERQEALPPPRRR